MSSSRTQARLANVTLGIIGAVLIVWAATRGQWDTTTIVGLVLGALLLGSLVRLR